jgi:hypothetical protein
MHVCDNERREIELTHQVTDITFLQYVTKGTILVTPVKHKKG